MNGTMHIGNINAGQMEISTSIPETRVRYTQASGLPDWIGYISGTIEGRGSTSPYYTTQIPNADQAETIWFGNEVTTITEGAFRNCKNLKNVVIPYGVTTITNWAFQNSGLTTLILPNSVTRIYGTEFANCLSGTFTIPDSITRIELYGTNIQSIKIGDSLIGNLFPRQNLSANSNLYNFTVSKDNPNYTAISHMLLSKDGKTLICGINGDVVIPNGVESIRQFAFDQFHNLTSVVIPSSVTQIGEHSFWHCDKLEKVIIDNGEITFFGGAFEDCSALNEVHISNIGAWCGCTFEASNGVSNPITNAHSFYNNNAIVTNLVIPNGTAAVNDYAFKGCSALTGLTIPDSVTSIGMYAFQDCSGLTSLTIPNGVTSIKASAFKGCSSLTRATIGNGITSVGTKIFEDCPNLISIYISDIGAWCKISFGSFLNNGILNSERTLYLNGTPVTNITIPGSVTTIGGFCLAGCSTLTEVTLSSGTTGISRGPFQNCINLTKITFPDTLTAINSVAFSGCSSLTVFDFRRATAIPTLQNVNAFGNTSSNKEIIVPDSLYDDWIAASNWSSTTNNIVNCIVKASQSSLGTL